MREEIHHGLDHITDLAGIAAITWMTTQGQVPIETITAVTSIAVGQRYAKAKWGNAYQSRNNQ